MRRGGCGVDFGETHHDTGELHCIEENLTEGEVARVRIVEAADDVPTECRAFYAAIVLGAAALAAAIHRGVAEALSGPAEFIEPVAAVAGVAVELEHGGTPCWFKRGS